VYLEFKYKALSSDHNLYHREGGKRMTDNTVNSLAESIQEISIYCGGETEVMKMLAAVVGSTDGPRVGRGSQ